MLMMYTVAASSSTSYRTRMSPRMQPANAGATSCDRILRIRLFSQQGDGSTRAGEQVLILAANAS
jgi:hypothetical protein